MLMRYSYSCVLCKMDRGDNNLLKPFVYWGQNKQSVFFKVEIAELDGVNVG